MGLGLFLGFWPPTTNAYCLLKADKSPRKASIAISVI